MRMFLSWLYDVFVGGWWQRVWFAGSVALIVLGIPNSRYTRPILLAVFVAGFIFSDVAVYGGLKKQLEQAQAKLRNLTFVLRGVQAGEHRTLATVDNPQEVRHTIVIEALVALKNGDGQDGRTVEIESCTCDLPNAALESLQFYGDPASPLFSSPGRYRTVAGGQSADVVLNAVFLLPLNVAAVAETEVTGMFQLSDNRGIALEIPFSATVLSNAVGYAL